MPRSILLEISRSDAAAEGETVATLVGRFASAAVTGALTPAAEAVTAEAALGALVSAESPRLALKAEEEAGIAAAAAAEASCTRDRRSSWWRLSA